MLLSKQQLHSLLSTIPRIILDMDNNCKVYLTEHEGEICLDCYDSVDSVVVESPDLDDTIALEVGQDISYEEDDYTIEETLIAIYRCRQVDHKDPCRIIAVSRDVDGNTHYLHFVESLLEWATRRSIVGTSQ